MKFKFLWFFCTATLQFSVADYYWRDYDGSIPRDAVQGGTDRYGYYTYIGQIAVFNPESPNFVDLISGTIYKGQKTAYAVHTFYYSESDIGVKILCSSQFDKLRWSRTIPSNCELIRGSFTANDTLHYIGRARIQEQNVTGRVSMDNKFVISRKLLPNPTQKFERVDVYMLMDCGGSANG